MLDGVANLVTKDVEDHLANDEEEDSKSNISKRPAILQGVRHKYDLHDNVYQQAYAIDKVQHHEKTHSVRWPESCPALEGQE